MPLHVQGAPDPLPSVPAVPSGLDPLSTYRGICCSLDHLQAAAAALLRRISDQVAEEGARLEAVTTRISTAAELIEQYGTATDPRAYGDEPLLLLSPALHPCADLRTGHLLFPQPSIEVAQDAPGKPVGLDGQHTTSWASGASEPGSEGRGDGGEGEDRDSVLSAGTPESAPGSGWSQVPQLLDFFTRAGFARTPLVPPQRGAARQGATHNEHTEQASAETLSIHSRQEYHHQRYLLAFGTNSLLAGSGPGPSDVAPVSVPLGLADLDSVMDESSKFRYVPNLSPLPFMRETMSLAEP